MDDWFDRAYDRAHDVARTLLDNGFIRGWFLWLEWVAVTAALYAIGRQSNSRVILVIALISGFLLWFGAWLTVERFVESAIPSFARKNRLLSVIAVLLVALIPLALAPFLSRIFTAFAEGRQ